MSKPQNEQEWREKCLELARLRSLVRLLAARPGTPVARLHNVSLSLADRVESGVEWLAQENSLLRAERDRLKAALQGVMALPKIANCCDYEACGCATAVAMNAAYAALTPQGQSTDGETR